MFFSINYLRVKIPKLSEGKDLQNPFIGIPFVLCDWKKSTKRLLYISLTDYQRKHKSLIFPFKRYFRKLKL